MPFSFLGDTMPRFTATVVLEVTMEITVEAENPERAAAIVETCNFANQVTNTPEQDLLCLIKTLDVVEAQPA